MVLVQETKHWIYLFYCYLVSLVASKFHWKKDIIVFGAWWGNKFDDNPAFLFEYVNKEKKDIKAVWITSNKKVLKEVRQAGYHAIYAYSLKAFSTCLKARFFVYCTGKGDFSKLLLPCLGGAVCVTTWHGIPLKKIGKDDNINKFNNHTGRRITFSNYLEKKYFKKSYAISTSPAISEIYMSAFNLTSSHVLNLGQARNDYFFQDKRNGIKETYKEFDKIVIYMPTHRNEGNTIMDMHKILDLKKINALCKEFNVIFLIKKHYFHRNEQCIGDSEYSNIRELTSLNPEVQEFMMSGDIMISDYSGSFIDYLLLDRPEIFYSYDLNDYLAKDRNLYREYVQENIPGRICTDTDQLIDELRLLFNDIDNYTSLREEIRNYYFSKWNQGIVCPQQIDKILTLE